MGAFYLAFIIFNMSCEVSEPERYYNAAAKTAETQEYKFANLKAGQKISGVIGINIDTADFDYKITRVDFYLNNHLAYSKSSYPFLYNLDAQNYSDGEYAIKAAIKFEGFNGKGALEDPSNPDLILAGNIIIDKSIPPAPKLILDEIEGVPHLSWNKTAENITGYVILSKEENAYWSALDTVYGADETEYYDSSFQSAKFGGTREYKVCPANNLQYIFYCESSPASITKGIMNFEGFCIRFLNNDEILLRTSIALKVYSLAEHRIKRALTLDGGTDITYSGYAYNPDISEFYCINRETRELQVVDLNSFAIKRRLKVPIGSQMDMINAALLVGASDEIILNVEDSLVVMDLNNGAVKKTFTLKNYSFYAPPCLSNDKADLFCVLWSNYAQDLQLVDLDMNSSQLTIKNQKYAEGPIIGIDNNDRIYLRTYKPEEIFSLNAKNLSEEKYFSLSNPQYNTFIIGDELYYLVSDGYIRNDFIKCEMNHMTELREWKFSRPIKNIVLSPDKKAFIASQYDGKNIFVEL